MKPVNPLVSVCVQTYQHVKYIRECLDSILMQKTSFPFEIVLGEDESSDGTREICKSYAAQHPDKIRLFLRSRKDVIYVNGNPTGRYNFIENLKAARGKYIALLEGDDYWTDPYKLQKQVDVLLQHEDVILCYHWQSVKYADFLPPAGATSLGENQPEFSTAKELFEWKIRVETRTILFRNIFKESSFPDWFNKVSFGDVSLVFILSAHGRFYFINEDMATYRRNLNGVSLIDKNKIDESVWQVQHSYKWLNIWLYANAYYNNIYKKEAVVGFNKLLKIALSNENMIQSTLRLVSFHISHAKFSKYILFNTSTYLFKFYLQSLKDLLVKQTLKLKIFHN